nr:hypothetical protein [Lachnospiraceae bacterium]
MKKTIAMLTVTSLLLGIWPAGVFGATDDASDAEQMSAEAAVPQETETEDANPEGDNIVTTKHEAVIKGETVSYTAETGTVTLKSGGVTCEMFYTAYTRDDAGDANDRPVTFAFNGGPGSSSYYIQFCLGPRRPELDESGYSLALPGKMIDNENSILDMTDLVFIDPVGTGYSHAVNEEETGEFLGYENDIRSVGDFIRHYINRHERWGSQKFIAGESYGTTRAVGLCEYLADQYSIYLNGLMLLSSVNDYSAILELPGNDNPTVFYVPTFAADAWYHGKLSEEYQAMGLEDYLEEVRTFVETEYAPALFLGRKIREDKKEQIAEKLAGYIGLSKDFVLKNDLRVSLEDFSVELLSDEKLMIGRYDGRITGPVINDGVSEPSGSVVDIAFFGPYMEFLTEELKFQTDAPFIPLSLEVNGAWSFADNYGAIAQEDVIYKCMSQNPYLKVWVLCGYYDSATPFYSAEWVYDHVFINEDRAKNLTFTYYPAGHMFYIDRESYDKFRKDAEEWYKDAS